MKRILGILLALMVTFTSGNIAFANEAPLVKASNLQKGSIGVYELSKSAGDGIASTGVENIYKGSSVYYSSWDIYSNNYVYNTLSSADKEIWNQLDVVCRKMLSTTSKAIASRDGYYFTNAIVTSISNKSKMRELFVMFYYSNPQYYFLNGGYLILPNGNYLKMYLCMYPSFADGSARQTYSNELKQAASKAISQAASYSKDSDKVKYFHDYIANQVDYYDGNIYASDYNDDGIYTQSAYSALCMSQTVCAGYALGLEMLCNGSGISCLAVTSTDHAWNKVCLGDSWYNIDLTWDDEVGYLYYLRSDSQMKKLDESYGGSIVASHTMEEFWSSHVPVCSLDSGSNVRNANNPKTITQKVATPKIKAKLKGSKYVVSLTCSTSGAKIYYTVNGTNPSCSDTISKVYKKSITLTKSQFKKLQVIAVKDRYKNSSIAKYKIQLLPIKITCNANGGKLSKNKTILTYAKKKVGTLSKPKRTGYTFKGWYTKKSGGKKVTSKSTFTASGKIYAHWKKKK